jgi:hypothetical protein
MDELLENVEVPVASSDESEEEVMPTRTANKTRRTLSSSEDEEHEEDDDGLEPVAKEILYPVGSYCIAFMTKTGMWHRWKPRNLKMSVRALHC